VRGSRAAADPAATMRALTTAIREIDRTVVPPAQVTMQDLLARQMNAQQFGAVVLGTLGGLAVLLALVATYVLAESMAVMRTRELGVRAALGATRRQLVMQMLGDTGRSVAAGLVAGLFLTWRQPARSSPSCTVCRRSIRSRWRRSRRRFWC